MEDVIVRINDYFLTSLSYPSIYLLLFNLVEYEVFLLNTLGSLLDEEIAGLHLS